MLKSSYAFKHLFVFMLVLGTLISSVSISNLNAMKPEDLPSNNNSAYNRPNNKRPSENQNVSANKRRKINSSELSEDAWQALLRAIDSKQQQLENPSSKGLPGEAFYKSGLQYLFGNERNFETALGEFNKAEQAGHAKAAYCSGVLCALGMDDQSKEISKAIQDIDQLLKKQKIMGLKAQKNFMKFLFKRFHIICFLIKVFQQDNIAK